MKELLKRILPDWARRFVTGLFYGWQGNYSSWEEALKKTTGYNSDAILNNVKEAALQVKTGQASYERDSVLFYEPDYSENLVKAIKQISSVKGNQVNILDFGGSLGSSYFQHYNIIGDLIESWSIVEQEAYVKEGKKHFEDDTLHFHSNVHECFKDFEIDLVILSSVLQYLEEPYIILDQLISHKPEGIFIDRTPFITGQDRITIQKVHPKIYKATYPCWFFNENIFKEFMSEHYSLKSEFNAIDRANIRSEFKGFFFILRNSK